MFWRFGFHNGSSIDSLLDKEDVSVEAFLDEEDLLQECKAQNTRLIDYFGRDNVLQSLLGYAIGQVEIEEKEQFKYPYIATEVLCSEIWSIVETCINKKEQLLLPFWETVLDRSPNEMKTQMTMANYFSKINSIFISKKPEEMFEFIQSQPNIVERLLRHIETPAFVDLLGRILQLDEIIPNCNVLEWFSSENFMGRLTNLLSPDHTPSVHSVVTDLIKNIISMATPSPTVGLTDGLQNGPASNRFARELAATETITKLSEYMLIDFVQESCDSTSSSEHDSGDGTLAQPTFESSISSVTHSIAVVVELIRKNNSDYFEPFLFHTLRNRLIQVQQHSQLSGGDIRTSLEEVMAEMVNRMGVVHLGPVLDVLSSRISDFQKYLKTPRSWHGPLNTTIGSVIPFTLERYRIVELYAELLHCSNMSLLNRSPSYAHMYDSQGRLQGGLSGLEELAQVIALNSSAERPSDNATDDDGEYSPPSAKDFPVRNPEVSSPSTLGSDGDMASDDEAMEEITMDDDPPFSPIPVTKSLPQMPPASPESTPPDLRNQDDSPSNADSDPSPRESIDKEQRRRSRSRRRPTIEGPTENLLPIGEQLKQRLLEENVVSAIIDLFFQFPWNNFLHSTVYDIVHQVMTGSVETGYNRDLIVSLFRDARMLHRIVEGQALNDAECSKPKGVRLGYMGHLMLISEDVITAMSRFPPDLRLSISQYAPEPEWDQFVTGRYNETKLEDNRLLGGGKPVVVRSSLPHTLSEWKVDENELLEGGGGPSKIESGGGMKSEFRRSDSPTVKQTADFGPPPPAPMDEEGDRDFMETHFARYLGREMGSDSESDGDDDDEGWLTQSTYGFSSGPIPRILSERMPLGHGFDDAFDPTSSPSTSSSSSTLTQNPFSSDDDDGFGPFSDAATTGSSDSFTFGSSSFSDEDSSFESFGDFGDFQGASEDGEMTPTTAGSWTFASELELVTAGLEQVRRRGGGGGASDGDSNNNINDSNPAASSSRVTNTS